MGIELLFPGHAGRRLVTMPTTLSRMLPGCMFNAYELLYIYKICGTDSHPRFTSSRLTSFRTFALCLQTQHSRVRKFVRRMFWRVSARCWTPKIRISHSTILKVGREAPSKKLMNCTWVLGEDYEWVEIGGLGLKLVPRCVRALVGKRRE
jgi:hypothetical protein